MGQSLLLKTQNTLQSLSLTKSPSLQVTHSPTRKVAHSQGRQVDFNDVGRILLYIKLTRFDLRIQRFNDSTI
jgi:hypothetical protein